ncbi:MAG: site-specific integrase [Lentimicrobiaceae bacterium]|nr:site-specific integrase [Lentimicrobiaceae bacterium]
MKKSILNTKVSVKLRKSEYADEWYLYLEAYPVFKQGSSKVIREREYLNRIITTPIWDKTRTARTTETKKTYKPKRDANGIIQCRSTADQEVCIYADNVRKLRQREFDNQALFTDRENELAEQQEKSNCNFIEYFEQLIQKRQKKSSRSVTINWTRVCKLFKAFAKSDTFAFSQINMKLIEDFKNFLLEAPRDGNKKGDITQNTASNYFSTFKTVLKQAFVDGYLTIDLSAKTKRIRKLDTRRETLTLEEINLLVNTECDKPIIKQGALFSLLTGLRHCDVKKLRWGELQKIGDKYRLNFTQQKTKGVEYMPISEQAYKLCGEPKQPEQLVFADLPDITKISPSLKKWIKSAGINRNITFHCLRHSKHCFSLKTSRLQNLNFRLLTIWKQAKFPNLSYSALLKRTLFLYAKVGIIF